MMCGILALYTLWLREMTRFFRQPSRIAGAIGTPLIFWFFLGSGLGGSFKMSAPDGGAGLSQVSYLQYFLPGTILLVILFTAIFSSISLIQDRSEGFLQSVLVSPAPGWAMIGGKVLGGTTVAVIQGMLFLAAAPLAGLPLSFDMLAGFALALFLNAFALSALGFALAWQFKSVQGFHAVMNLVLMPLWFLSGALFPPEGAPSWIRLAIAMNPLSHGLTLLHHALHGHLNQQGFFLSFSVVFGFGLALVFYSHWAATGRKYKNVL
ncbi:MAG: ABC transporter permease [Candidatus Omnitrophica bacterium]|nr:ABC transporter permease [Candidatus Omnitrophota bacterium]